MTRPDGVPIPKPISSKTRVRRGRQRAYAMEKQLEQNFRDAGDRGAKRSLASGAYKGIGQDGDVRASEFLAEAKSYTPVPLKGQKTLTVRLDWLYGEDGVIKQAKELGLPGIVVFQPKSHPYKVVLLDYDQFLALFTRWLRGE